MCQVLIGAFYYHWQHLVSATSPGRDVGLRPQPPPCLGPGPALQGALHDGGSRRGRVRAWSPDTRLQDLAPREAAGSHHRGFRAPEGRQEGAHLPEEARRAKESTWGCADASGALGSWGCGERKPTGCLPASLSRVPAPAGSAVLLLPQRCDECRAQSRAPTPQELALGARLCVRHPEHLRGGERHGPAGPESSSEQPGAWEANPHARPRSYLGGGNGNPAAGRAGGSGFQQEGLGRPHSDPGLGWAGLGRAGPGHVPKVKV